MIADYFWKIIFIIGLIFVVYFWKNYTERKKDYQTRVAQLSEIMDLSKDGRSRSNTETESRVYRSIYILHALELNKGKKFKIREVLDEALNLNETSISVKNLLKGVFTENYSTARKLGLLREEDALERFMDGKSSVIRSGAWSGELLVVGHYISPEINDTVSFHIANRIILPMSVKAAMEFADITKDVRDRADRMKRAGVLDVASCDSIINQYNTLRELATRN